MLHANHTQLFIKLSSSWLEYIDIGKQNKQTKTTITQDGQALLVIEGY